MRAWLLLLALTAVAGAVEVPLRAPLCTLVPAEGTATGDRELVAELVVGADAPDDLGVGAFVRDREGRWFQRARPGILTPGRHRLAFRLAADQLLTALPLATDWRRDDAVLCDQAGLFLWSARSSAAVVRIESLAVRPLAARPAGPRRLGELAIDGLGADGRARAATGERWTARVLPAPFPANPCDPREFALDAVITGAEGERRIPCAWVLPMRGADRGDREIVTAAGAGRFELRFRPTVPGTYAVRLEARWQEGPPLTVALPPLVVTGAEHDPFLRVDGRDARFFAVDGRWTWPIGLNLHSTYDVRSRDVHGTRLTPARGTLVYEAMLDRLAAAGGDACEIWMSSWNLALEWRGDWPGYHGLGRYSQENAWRLDRVLDHAWKRGIRVNLVLNNHGQISPKSDREWKDNPYNTANGGVVAEAADWFTDEDALAHQDRLRRYVVARWADHPAVLGWKLFSEVNLTAGRGAPLVRWHALAAERLDALDSYGHPISSHWSGDYKQPDPAICALPGLTYLCIDAYRSGGHTGTSWRPAAELMAASTADPDRGLVRFGKPVLVTEYVGSWKDSPEPVRDADLRSAPWAALVSGHAGAPMCWWWEWVDQTARWQTYGAIRRFIAGEDLRGEDAHAATLAVEGARLWCGAWVRPGRLLAYVVEPRWAVGEAGAPVRGATLVVAAQARAGAVAWEWWDCDRGEPIARGGSDHDGGRLVLPIPELPGHLALKLWRPAEPVR